jgi:hypothetical protein
MEAELHITLYFENFENYIFKFQKILKKLLGSSSQLWNLQTCKILM